MSLLGELDPAKDECEVILAREVQSLSLLSPKWVSPLSCKESLFLRMRALLAAVINVDMAPSLRLAYCRWRMPSWQM